MVANTNIEWCDATFNPWWGCAKVDDPCANCYAETWARRVGNPDLWGPDAKRRFFAENHWSEPLRWNEQAARKGEQRRVFCASMADVFDNHPSITVETRHRLWKLMEATPNLTWLVLTKRIGNAEQMLPTHWLRDGLPKNVWPGISVGTQKTADRDIKRLTSIKAAVRFLSVEPLLEPLRLPLGQIMTGFPQHITREGRAVGAPLTIHQVIVGGESGPKARSMDIRWAMEIVGDCITWGVAPFVKQLGAKPTFGGNPYPITDRKGAIMSDWPECLRVREFPKVPA